MSFKIDVFNPWYIHVCGLEINKFILKMFVNISIVICQIAGTIIHDKDPMGLLETNGDEDGNVKGTSYLIKP